MRSRYRLNAVELAPVGVDAKCSREGIPHNVHDAWMKDFTYAGKTTSRIVKRLVVVRAAKGAAAWGNAE